MATDTHTENAQTGHGRKTTARDEPKFSRERLLDRAGERITGRPRHIVAGALVLADGRKREFTRSEIRDLVDKFLTRRVQPKEAASR